VIFLSYWFIAFALIFFPLYYLVLALAFAFGGPDVRLVPSVAVSIAMVLNELATNATKYGALSVETGSVTVSWKIVDNTGKRVLRVRWKELGGPKLSREERKVEKAERRTAMADRRERMMAGQDAYLLPRDKGPVRRFVRDVVDARRNVLGLFMPAALGMVFVMLSIPSLAVQQAVTPAMLVLILVMAADALLLGRRVNKLVDEKFPDNVESGWKLGMYAASRASQLRRMRAPRPQVERGAKVD